MLHDPATLTAAIHNTAARAVPFATETFDTVQIADIGGKTYDLGTFDTLDAAIERCAIHKARFFVRVTNHLTGAVLLKFYQVRKGKPVRRYADYQTRVVADCYAEHLFDLDGGAF
jgi:hypothetical protein